MRYLHRFITIVTLILIATGGFTQCPTANFTPSDYYLCANDTVQFSDQSYDSCATGRVWVFGDGDSSQLKNPTHQYSFTQDKLVIVQLCIEDTTATPDTVDCHTDTLFYTPRCVWPGDANYDGIVNNYDLLHVGLAHGSSGTSRPNASIQWEKQFAWNWSGFFMDSTNHKHADCNGNSVVDDADTIPILLNYNKTHNKKPPSLGSNPADPPLRLEFPKDSILAGEPVNVNIKLGSDTLPANNVYGMAFCVDYDPTLVDSGSITLSINSSQLGGKSKLVELHKDFPVSGQVDAGISRNNQLNTSTTGRVGQFTIVMEDDLSAKDSLITETLHLKFCDATVISNNQSNIQVNVQSDSIVVYDKVGDISPSEEIKDNIHLYPNPFHNNLIIETESVKIDKIQVFNQVGQQVLQQAFTTNTDNIKLDTEHLSEGFYFIKCSTENGVVSKKVAIIH
jgi:hypothetical protein